MPAVVGHDAARAQFVRALAKSNLHHAWLLTGPKGVGKASFALAAAIRMLAEASDGGQSIPNLTVAEGNPVRSLVMAGSHPDLKLLTRLPKDASKSDDQLARSITIAQIRSLQPMFATTPSLSPRRVVIIDAIDDVERGGANALLKNLEEPPAGTIFLLVSHAPGRLLPTIRSRCRVLRFEPLKASEMETVLRRALPDSEPEEIAALISAGQGAPGVALSYAGLGIADLDGVIEAILHEGGGDSGRRAALARSLGSKSAQPRYEAFLDRVPAHIANVARTRQGPALHSALDAHQSALRAIGAARGLSLEPQTTIYELAGILSSLKA